MTDHKRYLNQFTRQFSEALEKVCPEEKIIWEIVPGMSPEGLVLAIVVFTRGALLGTWNQSVRTMPAILDVSAEQMEQIVREILSNAMEARSQQLQQQTPANGQDPRIPLGPLDFSG